MLSGQQSESRCLPGISVPANLLKQSDVGIRQVDCQPAANFRVPSAATTQENFVDILIDEPVAGRDGP
jgi:hypothetical protein